MKISFLCGSAEPAKCGVGDYVRLLATNLIAAGHECQVIALADRHIVEPAQTFNDNPRFEVVRTPFACWAAGDTQVAEAALNRFKADWVSLQMVCYSFENRGVLLRTPRLLSRLQGSGRRHIMLHELWIGDFANSKFRDRMLGKVQKYMLARAIDGWAPHVIHTSNPVYRELLHRNGIAAAELPLPGNIPKVPVDRSIARRWLLAKIFAEGGYMESPVLAGVFGSVHPEWNTTDWLSRLHALCSETGRPLMLVHVGRMGTQGEGTWKRMQRGHAGLIQFHSLGELPAPDISMALHAFDFGISTTPWWLSGKSGAVSAMLEHHLPVLVPRDDSVLRQGATPEPKADPLLVRLTNDSTFQDFVRPPVPTVAERHGRMLYSQFIDDLSSA